MYGSVTLIYLSKAFDTLYHDHLIANVHSYGFTIKPYLTDRWQLINSSFSSWTEFVLDVHQGSVLGPLLFNLIINYLFYLFNDTGICNYADDNIMHAYDTTLDARMAKIERADDKAAE